MGFKKIKDEDFEKLLLILRRCDKTQLNILSKKLNIDSYYHPIEDIIKVKPDILLNALMRSSYITLNGIRGIIAESTFNDILDKSFKSFKSLPTGAENPYDFLLEDTLGQIRVQIKLQRKLDNLPWIRKNGHAVVETYKTRSGKNKDGESTRPYRYGEFDLLGVCMEPSHGRWDSFLYIPQKFLEPDKINFKYLNKYQSVPLTPKDNWNNNLKESIDLFRKDGNFKTISQICFKQIEFAF